MNLSDLASIPPITPVEAGKVGVAGLPELLGQVTAENRHGEAWPDGVKGPGVTIHLTRDPETGEVLRGDPPGVMEAPGPVQRAQFEWWAARTLGIGNFDRTQDEDADYLNPDTNDLWRCWQESAAGVTVGGESQPEAWAATQYKPHQLRDNGADTPLMTLIRKVWGAASGVALPAAFSTEQVRRMADECGVTGTVQALHRFAVAAAAAGVAGTEELKQWLADPANYSPRGVAVDGSYRLLENGEVMQTGDEILDDDTVTWHPVDRWAIGTQWNGSAYVPVRRRTTGVTVPSDRERMAAAMEALEDNDPQAAFVILKTALAAGVPEPDESRRDRIGQACAEVFGWRKCEFCGCNTNANARACCEKGRAADGVLASDGGKPE